MYLPTTDEEKKDYALGRKIGEELMSGPDATPAQKEAISDFHFCTFRLLKLLGPRMAIRHIKAGLTATEAMEECHKRGLL